MNIITLKPWKDKTNEELIAIAAGDIQYDRFLALAEIERRLGATPVIEGEIVEETVPEQSRRTAVTVDDGIWFDWV